MTPFALFWLWCSVFSACATVGCMAWETRHGDHAGFSLNQLLGLAAACAIPFLNVIMAIACVVYFFGAIGPNVKFFKGRG